MKYVRLILGSKNDKEKGNEFLKILKEIGIGCEVSIASCHRHIGGGFEKVILSSQEKVLAMMGGMELAAPGIIESLDRNAKRFNGIIFGIPLDKAARSAIENLPKGTAIITSGFNEVNVNHSIINSALSVAKLSGLLYNDLRVSEALEIWYAKMAEENPLVPEVKLLDGLIQ